MSAIYTGPRVQPNRLQCRSCSAFALMSAAKNIANILIEALPYIRRFQGRTMVIKYGGNAMVEPALKASFARDVILMKLVGMQPVVVHGGGPQISATLKKFGKESTFINGMRVTDEETMTVVEMVLGGVINQEIVASINHLGGSAVGLTGKDGNLIRAKKLHAPLTSPVSTGANEVDYGQVGEVDAVNPELIHLLETRAFIPVIAPLGTGDGKTYNINADLVAAQLAIKLRAEKLIFLTNTPGVLDHAGELLPSVKSAAVAGLRADGTLAGGMLPKVDCAVEAIHNGVQSALIIDGRVEHALLLELFTDAGIGTQIVA